MLFLQYSPDLNPIELFFAKLKGFLRKAAQRTIPMLRRKIGALLAPIVPSERANYFKHSGYGLR